MFTSKYKYVTSELTSAYFKEILIVFIKQDLKTKKN